MKNIEQDIESIVWDDIRMNIKNKIGHNISADIWSIIGVVIWRDMRDNIGTNIDNNIYQSAKLNLFKN